MTNPEPRRARPVRKLISFSDSEWATVERRMSLAEASSFDEFARRTILDGEVKVRKIAFDPAPLGAELARIGNNINQIARHVNTEDAVTFSEMQAARAMLRQVQALLDGSIKAGGDVRGGRGHAQEQEHH